MTLRLIAYGEQKLAGSNFPNVALRMELWRNDDGSDVDAAGNNEDLYGKVMLVRRGTGGTTSFNNGGPGAAAGSVDVIGRYSATGLNYDFRSASGMGTPCTQPLSEGVTSGSRIVLWESWLNVTHDSNGTKTNMPFAATWTGDSNLGSGTVTGTVTLPTIVQVPTAPTSVAAVRVSDTSLTLSWSQTNPGNGQPTSNEYRRRVNGGAWSSVTSISPTTSVGVSAAADQKIEFQVRGVNSAGASAWSTASSPVYTTPDAPTNVTAVKDASLNIDVSFTSNVAYTEHEHVIEHSADGGAYSALTTLSSGVTTYEHATPNPAQTHRYRVRARSTTGSLTSAWVESATVQLLAAPNKPTLPNLPDYAAKDAPFIVGWTHNPVDTTPQSAYEMETSTDGGTTWTSTGKVTSTTSSRTIIANTYAANDTVTLRVRTWGQATSGGSEGTGASPWSDPQAVTFKSAPGVSIISPSGVWNEADLTVTLGFSQAEGATFVQATVVLSQGATVLEERVSGSLSDIRFATPVANGETYTLTATVRDSNGVDSVPAEVDFDVAYTLPVAAGVTVTYLPDSGVAQISLTFAAPGIDEAAAVAVTITRTIDDVAETIVAAYPITGSTLTIIDTTPTIHGDNVYIVRTLSDDNAATEVTETLTTAEPYFAFLSTGASYSRIVSFFGDLQFSAKPNRASALMQAAGRVKPIALYGVQTTLVVTGSATLVPDGGSTPGEIEAFLLEADLVCYRDPSGRRIFGRVTGTVASPSSLSSRFEYEVTEAT